jgi:hypothetical protein
MPDASPDSDRKPILAVICLGDQNTGIASFFWIYQYKRLWINQSEFLIETPFRLVVARGNCRFLYQYSMRTHVWVKFFFLSCTCVGMVLRKSLKQWRLIHASN